jgi:hypothetical protein
LTWRLIFYGYIIFEYEFRNRSSPNDCFKKRIILTIKLISEISKNGELSKFSASLQSRKQYDISETEYI